MKSAFCTLLLAAGAICQTCEPHGIVTSVTCSAANYPVATSTSACAQGISAQPDSALASVVASLSIGQYAVDASITTFSTAMGDPRSGDPFDFVPSSAIAAADITATLQTGGPVRSGYLGLSFPEFGSLPTLGTSDGWTSTAMFSIGSFQLDCANASAVEYCAATDFYSLDSGATVLLPITLGRVLPLDFNVSNEGYSDMISGFADGGFAGSIEVRAFEADGVTPVALSEVPEPSSCRLVAFAVVAAVSLGCRYRRRSNPNL